MLFRYLLLILPLLLLPLLLLPLPAHAEMPRVDLSYGMYRIDAEVAHTDSNRQRGLMHRREMAAQQGMLFVFTREEKHCMWMRNTLIPLSVAFLDQAGAVINIADMTPHDETAHCAAKPARFALEMNQGWFAARGIKAGNLIKGIERVPTPR